MVSSLPPLPSYRPWHRLQVTFVFSLFWPTKISITHSPVWTLAEEHCLPVLQHIKTFVTGLEFLPPARCTSAPLVRVDSWRVLPVASLASSSIQHTYSLSQCMNFEIKSFNLNLITISVHAKLTLVHRLVAHWTFTVWSVLDVCPVGHL